MTSFITILTDETKILSNFVEKTFRIYHFKIENKITVQIFTKNIQNI